MCYQGHTPRGGALVLGQPGTGMFQFRLSISSIPSHMSKLYGVWPSRKNPLPSIRLLMLEKDVLFTYQDQTKLFYRGHVYQIDHLLPQDIPTDVIWSLIDLDTNPSCAVVTGTVFPVQTSLPRPKRFSPWTKHRSALRCIVPLWTFRDLLHVYVLLLS